MSGKDEGHTPNAMARLAVAVRLLRDAVMLISRDAPEDTRKGVELLLEEVTAALGRSRAGE